LATTAAGTDVSKAALTTSATYASMSATIAMTDASYSSNANTALIAANRKAQKLTAPNINIGKIRYNIKTGSLTFNGKSLTDPDQSTLVEACKDVLKRGR